MSRLVKVIRSHREIKPHPTGAESCDQQRNDSVDA